ncbi:MAG: hypothetical protein HeimC3_06710 [Candidatus Heimdallarchaeota archaeon LC_3]|nr:MAG: hypothetical protein HeimC3_06710 [Candidatus Heimdallarchaeota archaeon LC_3]
MKILNVVDKQLEAYNERNIKDFVGCYSNDKKAYLLESNKLISDGKKQLEKSMKESFNSNANAKTKLMARITQNNLIIDHEEITNYSGGKTVKTVAVYEVINDLITKIWFGGRTVE